jgi:hypothetical protein
MARFVSWYNEEHRHSAIRYVTPDQRHSGRDVEILERRHEPTALRLRVPILALTPILVVDDAQASLGGELEEVIVTATSIKFDVILNHRDIHNQVTQVGRQVGHSAAGQSLTAATKQAEKCALMFSKGQLGTHSGENPNYTTIINSTQWGWGTETDGLPGPIATNTNVSPGAGYFPIEGQTKLSIETTYVFVQNVARDAAAAGSSFKREMVNTLVHEWYHQWFPLEPHQNAINAGNRAEQAYVAAGGDSLTCDRKPA